MIVLKILGGVAVYLGVVALLAGACGLNREGDKIAEETVEVK